MTRPHPVKEAALRAHLRPALALCLLLAAGCDRAGTGPLVDTTARVEGRCVLASDGTPVRGARVVLLAWPSLAALATAESDGEGRYAVELPAPVAVLPAAWHPTLELFHLPRLELALAPGERRQLELGFTRSPTLPATGLRLEGAVVDDGTGHPIEGAVVEMTWPDLPGAFPELEGRFPVLRTVTGADGAFVLDPLPQVLRLDGRLETPHWRVTARGYRSEWRPGYVDGVIPPPVVLRMQRGVDPGVVEGTVVSPDGRPLAGVELRADWRRGDGALFRQAVPSVLATSDSSGSYRLEGLPLGGLLVGAGTRGDDGWWRVERRVELTEESPGLVALPIPVSPAVSGEAPARGDSLDWARGFRWDPFPGAAGYRLLLRDANGTRGSSEIQPGPSWVPAGPGFPLRGAVLWSVQVLGGGGELLSASDRERACVVGPPPGEGNP